MFIRHLSVPLRTLPLVLALTLPALAQGADPRSPFLDALGAFSLALDGARGDEGGRLAAALDDMERTLSQWDATIAGYERAMRDEIQGADAPLAARMRTALGVVYLDRGRVQDALAQFAMARSLDPMTAEAPLLEGLLYGEVLNDSDRAAESLRAAAVSSPEAVAPAYSLARLLRRAGRAEDAAAAVDALIGVLDKRASRGVQAGGAPRFIRVGLVPEAPGLEPFLPPVRYAGGFAALQRGDLSGALVAFREALAGDPLTTTAAVDDGLELRAAAAFRDGLVDDARDALNVSITRSPARAERYRLLGLVEVADGRYAEGITALRRAVAIDPSEERARLGLADALARSGQPDAAIAALRDTLAAIPDSGRARYALARLHREQARYLDALSELQETVRHGPLLGLNSVYQTIGALRRAQLELEGAIEAYTVRAGLTPNDPDAHQDLGDVHLLLGDTRWALVEFQVALALDPSRGVTHSTLAQVFLREGRYQDAVDSALGALRLDPGDRDARYAYATALVRLGRTEEGNRELQTFRRLQTEDAETRARGLELGRLRREAALATAAGNHAAAADLFQQALVLDPRATRSHFDLGLALLGAGRFPEAIDRLSTAAALDAPLEVHLRLAEAYEATGRPDDAERARATYAALQRDAIRRAGAGR